MITAGKGESPWKQDARRTLFIYPLGTSPLPEGFCPKGKKPKAARRKSHVCSHAAPPHPPDSRDSHVDSAKNQSQPPVPKEELEPAFPRHLAPLLNLANTVKPLPAQPGFLVRVLQSWALPDPSGGKGPRASLGQLSTSPFLCSVLLLSLPLPPSAFLSLKAPSQDILGGRIASSPPAVFALCLISDMRTVQCKLTKCF